MAKLWDETVETTAKKPHPFSKEARAARESNQPTPVKENTSDLSAVIDRLNKLEQENKALKDSMVHPNQKWQERNADPKQFKYKMRGGVPVISWETKRLDPSKDLVFKNKFGQYESNHMLALSLLDWTIVDVEVNEFGIHHNKSDYKVAKDQNGWFIYDATLAMVKTLTFEDENGEFTLDLKFAN